MSKNQSITVCPEGLNSVNPIIFSEDALKTIEFIVKVFGGTHDEGALTYDPDGKIFHSQVFVDTTSFTIVERKEQWPHIPALTQIYVNDVESAIARALELGATVITEPTEYVGVNFSRVQDAQGNIWWIWKMLENYDWETAFGDTTEDEPWKPTKEALYVHDSLVEHMNMLSKN